MSKIFLLVIVLPGCGGSSTSSGGGAESAHLGKGVIVDISSERLANNARRAVSVSAISPLYISIVKMGYPSRYEPGMPLGSRTVVLSSANLETENVYLASVLVHEQCHSVNNHYTRTVATEAICLREQANWLRLRGEHYYASYVESWIGTHGGTGTVLSKASATSLPGIHE